MIFGCFYAFEGENKRNHKTHTHTYNNTMPSFISTNFQSYSHVYTYMYICMLNTVRKDDENVEGSVR